ncbi:MAG: GNAT family N-acetyltransferase [Chlorobi bacterium]|nr:GNAT family N-acetyltransferase [Chlorobiota bacterium]
MPIHFLAENTEPFENHYFNRKIYFKTIGLLHPAYRHKGIGKKLFDDAVEHLRQFHDRIIPWAESITTEPRRFYERYGFHPEGRYKQWVRGVLESDMTN